jgi:hypothetical protein
MFLFIYGHSTGNYIYPVFDVGVLGVFNVAIFILAVAALFLGIAYALYFIDKKIGGS